MASTVSNNVTNAASPHALQGDISNSTTSNEFDFNTLKVGDMVAGMRVVSIDPAVESLPLSAENLKVRFEGEAIVTGKYSYDPGPGMGPAVLFGDLTAESEKKVPKLLGQAASWFGFTNESSAEQAFAPAARGAAKGDATIKIKNYTYIYVPAEAWSTAELVSVICKN